MLRLDGEVSLDWEDGAPEAECSLVWSVSPDRLYLRTPVSADRFDRVDDPTQLFHVDPRTGTVVELAWRGPSDEVDGSVAERPTRPGRGVGTSTGTTPRCTTCRPLSSTPWRAHSRVNYASNS
ncbi:hypothetical protein EF847_07680 [Actinobacteria bacterium YIM 96077]|uniref:Uncharacterized protein n=1 Tax=Phytoactinopolyspora halophila TaxID=1981511 RepID=A0A329QM37_9ACTN|nr:hypothetical protein EF847_07680 [Actinobacteria bacterium YIM 96077]RAW12492.1 hypothetical protein DPM12_13910 [Phytoactinopolyspora halophila]